MSEETSSLFHLTSAALGAGLLCGTWERAGMAPRLAHSQAALAISDF